MKLKEVAQTLENDLIDLGLEKRKRDRIIELSDERVAVSVWDHQGDGEASVAVAGTKHLENKIGYWGNIALVDYLRTKHEYKLPTIGARFISPVANDNFGEYNIEEEALVLFGNIARDYLAIVRNLDSTTRDGLLEYDSQMRGSFDATKELKSRLREQEEQRKMHGLKIRSLLSGK